jgi:sugar lactone lactonase YvrE
VAQSWQHGKEVLFHRHVPEGVAVDAFGNLYIANSGDNRIRKVFLNTASVIPTVSAVVNGATNAAGGSTPAHRRHMSRRSISICDNPLLFKGVA